jgi:hypothetical protein
MGLDMYLSAEKYVSGWDHNEDIASGSPAGTLSLNVMYWRKANAIHKWFVKRIQGGDDDCGRYYVSHEDLKVLKKTCEDVLNDRSKAPELLPTTSGFFFGPTEYDDHYFQDLQETTDGIGKLLMDPKYKGWAFFYQSSW